MPTVPTGTLFFIATAFAGAKATGNPSNAVEAVVPMADTAGLAVGNIVEIVSTWGRLNKRAWRLKAVVNNVSVTLEDCDTTSEQFFPPGGGGGSLRKVDTWQEITEVTGVTSSGGDPIPVDFKYLSSDVKYSKNDGFNATNYQLTLDSDSIGTAGYTALRKLTDVQTDTILRITKRNGGVSLVPCTVALNEAEAMNDGQINTCVAAFNGNNRMTRYKPPVA